MATGNEPTFGPLETPVIFATKWYHKFFKHGLSPDWTTNEGWIDWLLQGCELYIAFEEQRRALGFEKDALKRIRMSLGPQQGGQDDVWNGAGRTRDLINYQLEAGDQTMRRNARAMPEVKAKFDVLMDRVTMAVVDGIWNGEISERSREVMDQCFNRKSFG